MLTKIKTLLQKISTSITLATLPLVASPVSVSATEDVPDLLNTTITSDGLNIPGDTTSGGTTDGIVATFNALISRFRVVITGVTGILALVMVGIFIWKAFQFAQSSSNPSARAQSITGLIVFAIAAALFGSASLFVGLAYGVFR